MASELIGTEQAADAARRWLDARPGSAGARVAWLELSEAAISDPVASLLLQQGDVWERLAEAIELVALFPCTLQAADEFAFGKEWCWPSYGQHRNVAIEAGWIPGQVMKYREYAARRRAHRLGIDYRRYRMQRMLPWLLAAVAFALLGAGVAVVSLVPGPLGAWLFAPIALAAGACMFKLITHPRH